MRTETNTIEIYTFKEASSELKNKIREHFSNDHDLYEFNMEERISTLKAFSDLINANLDYALSCVPDRGEFISIQPEDNFNEFYEAINDFINNNESCSLTGVCYDDDLKHYLKESDIYHDGLKEVWTKYIDSMHNEYEYMLTDDYLSEHCEANEYEFTIDGNLY